MWVLCCLFPFLLAVMLLYNAFAHFIHGELVMLRARLEVVLLLGVIFAYAHRVLGYALGTYYVLLCHADYRYPLLLYFPLVIMC